MSLKTAYVPLLVFLFFSFIIFTAFRFIDVGGIGGMDAFGYKRDFENADESLIRFLIYQSKEPVYSLFVWFVRRFTQNFTFLLILYYTVIFIIQIKILSNIKITSIISFTYFAICFILILTSFNLMRNILSLFVGYLSYNYLDGKKYFRAFLAITIATLIHFSAVICYPVWLLCFLCDKKQFRLKRSIFYFLLAFIGLFLMKSLVPNFMLLINKTYSIYFSNEKVAINTFVSRFYIILLVLLRWNSLIKHNKMNRIMFIVVLINFLVLPLQTIVSIMYRMLLMADIAIFYLISELMVVCSLTKRSHLLHLCIRFSLIGYLIIYIFIFITKNMPSYGLGHYSNVLLK
jgi:hypothetical protein